MRPRQVVRNDARRSKDRFPFFAVDGVVAPFGALCVEAMPGAAIPEDRLVHSGNDPTRVLPAPKPSCQRPRGDAVTGRETRWVPNKQTRGPEILRMAALIEDPMLGRIAVNRDGPLDVIDKFAVG